MAGKGYIKKKREVPGDYSLDYFYESLCLPKGSSLLLDDPWLAMYLCREKESDRKRRGWTAGKNILLSSDKNVFYADLTKNCNFQIKSKTISSYDIIRKLLADMESFCNARGITVFAFTKRTEKLCKEGTGSSFHALTAKTEGSAGIVKRYISDIDDYLSLYYFFDPVRNRYFFSPKMTICKDRFMDNMPIKPRSVIIPCEREIKEILNRLVF